jgi:hypothetical protein
LSPGCRGTQDRPVDYLFNYLATTAAEYREQFGYGSGGHHPVPAAALVGLDISEEMGREFARFKLAGIEPHGNRVSVRERGQVLNLAQLIEFSREHRIDKEG